MRPLPYGRGSVVPASGLLLTTLCLAAIALPSQAQTPKPPTYDDDVRPIFQRRCFACHSAAEARAGLSLESYVGVLKGGGSGDIVIPGRPGASLLYKVVA